MMDTPEIWDRSPHGEDRSARPVEDLHPLHHRPAGGQLHRVLHLADEEVVVAPVRVDEAEVEREHIGVQQHPRLERFKHQLAGGALDGLEAAAVAAPEAGAGRTVQGQVRQLTGRLAVERCGHASPLAASPDRRVNHRNGTITA
jgi:hypothetical protein